MSTSGQRRYQLPFLLRWTKKLMNFGLLTAKLCLLILTYPTSTVRAFSDNFRLIAYISRIDIDIDKRKTAFKTTINSTSNAEKLVNLCSQTTKFCCLIANHPSLTLRLLYMYMTMQLRSGHVTLLRTKFQFLNSVFFNFFAAAEPHTNVKVTHGTPCIDRRTRGWSYRVSTNPSSIAGQSSLPWRRQNKQKWPIIIWNLTALVGSSIVGLFNQTRRARRSLTAV